MGADWGFDNVSKRLLRRGVQASYSVTPPITPPPPSGTQFYVALTGNDSTGVGSAASPWRTVQKAASVVTNGTINVAAGTYVETSTINLKDGVSLVGAGQVSTVIQAATAFSPLVLLSNTTQAQTISDMTFDGRTRSTSDYGIQGFTTRYLTVTRITAKGFKATQNCSGGGLHLFNVTDAVISYCTFTDCGTAQPTAYVSGNFAIGNALRVEVHHCTSTVTATGQGYCFKSAALNYADTYNVTMTDVQFHDNTFVMVPDSQAAWNSIAMEAFNTTALRVDFYHNTINGPLSLTGLGQNPATGTADRRWHIHHNYWNITSGNFYAIELMTSSSEVDHNYFTGGYYPIYNSMGTTWLQSDMNIHHNVFDNQINPVAVMNLDRPQASNYTFTKNTIICRHSFSSGLFALQGTNQVVTITDNIFYSTAAIGDNLGAGLGSSPITGNVFYNITVNNYGDTNSIFTNPNLPLSGGFPAAYIPAANTGYGAMQDGSWSDVGVQ